MKRANNKQSLCVLLSCGCGIVAALLHYLIPNGVTFDQRLPEYLAAGAAAVLSLAALGLFYFGFLLPQLRQKQGLCGTQVFYMPALCWSAFGLPVGAAATVVKLILALSYGFVPPQSEGADYSFSVLILVNVPVLLCFAVLYLREQKKQPQ